MTRSRLTLRKLRVFKYSAAGNTFVLVDLRDPLNHSVSEKMLPQLAQKLSKEFATDGLLFVSSFPNSKLSRARSPVSTRGKTQRPQPLFMGQNLKLIFFNPDGSRAFCGNGTRAAGFHEIHLKLRKLNGKVCVQTDHGPITVAVERQTATLANVSSPRYKGKRDLQLHNSKLITFYSLWSGCPHAVTFVRNLSKIDVDKVGHAVRYHRQFAPEGTNVNFLKLENGGAISLRTYERGVERETASCGSGVLSAAQLMRHLGKVNMDRLLVKTRGGNFEIHYRGDGTLSLQGEVKLTFDGAAYV